MKKIIPLLLLVSFVSPTFSVSQETPLFDSDKYYKKLIEDSKRNPEYESSRFRDSMTQESYEEVFGSPTDILNEDKKHRFGHQGRTITIDTRKKDVCEKVRETLRKYRNDKVYDDICDTDPAVPFVSISLIDKKPTDIRLYLNNLSSKDDKTPGKYDKVLKETRNFVGLGLTMMGLLYALPEDVSKWDREDIKKNWHKKYFDNIKEGPVVDKDDWWINYIGHPISGAAYHVVARHAGLDAWESFGYGVLMSTFFWEYGFEAIAETPSIQDLILTPVIGSILGELFYALQLKIEEDDGKLYGSEFLGSVVGTVTNPAAPILNFFNGVFEAEVLKDAESYFYLKEAPISYDGINVLEYEKQVGVEFYFRF